MIDTAQQDNIALAKYNIYISRLRNVFQGTSLGMALIGFSQSNLIDHTNSRNYILTIGVSIITITFFYGLDNVMDYQNYVYKHGINDGVKVLDANSVYNDIFIIKILLTLLLIILLMIILNIFY